MSGVWLVVLSAVAAWVAAALVVAYVVGSSFRRGSATPASRETVRVPAARRELSSL